MNYLDHSREHKLNITGDKLVLLSKVFGLLALEACRCGRVPTIRENEMEAKAFDRF